VKAGKLPPVQARASQSLVVIKPVHEKADGGLFINRYESELLIRHGINSFETPSTS
jgi:hypothetical protein